MQRPQQADKQALAALVKAHIHAVPFENLDVNSGKTIDPTAIEPIFDKVVHRHRGGICYELNGLFAALLAALGYDVQLVAGCVRPPDMIDALFDHMVPIVRLDGQLLLVDVGFGRFSQTPLALDDPTAQLDRFGVYRVQPGGLSGFSAAIGPGATVACRHNGSAAEAQEAFELGTPPHSNVPVLDIQVQRKAEDSASVPEFKSGAAIPEFKTVYTIELQPRCRFNFTPHSWWHSTCPDSAFTQSVICSRVTETGRVSIAGNKLIETPDDGERRETMLKDDEVCDAYKRWFGIVLDVPPTALHPREGAPQLA